MPEEVVRVALSVPAKEGLFDYAVPAELEGRIVPGQILVVPFGSSLQQAIVWQCNVTSEVKQLRAVSLLVDEKPVLSPAQLKLAALISKRALAPLTDCINLLLTERVRKVSSSCFHLLKRDFSFQCSLFSDDSVMTKDQMSGTVQELFSANDDRLTEDELNKAFGKGQWEALVDGLLKNGSIEREQTFILPKAKPKMVRCLSLGSAGAAEFEKKLSRLDTVSDRRRKVIEYLREHGQNIPLSEIYQFSGSDNSDISALQKKGLVTVGMCEVWRDHQHYMSETVPEKVRLTHEQQEAVDLISAGLNSDSKRRPVLLHGVTGSGKTEVYLRAAACAISAGKQVLMLVPEIALTPQILSRFEQRFPGITGVYHSKLDNGERYDTWRRGRDGQYRIIVGPRSCLSVPLPDLGLIIVDECHEDSYFQTEGRPYFSAVRAAADLAEICNAQLVLGSATPTVAQMFKAQSSHWHIVSMKERATGIPQPDTLLIDMREELKSGNSSIFSRSLIHEMARTLEMGRQVILFLNRRGSQSYTFCHYCGKTFLCPKCDIPYTWHAARRRLECHFCGSQMDLPQICPDCGSTEIRQFGAGVEKVEEQVHELFPQARVLRMDADTVAEKGSHEKMLTSFARHETDILIGTQMVAKGLDFPDVRLVGVLLADVGSNFHDYRVDEHSFQMLTQVTGRAGRAREKGLAILQTFQPERYSIRAAAVGSYDRFFADELKYRKLTGYPPFSRMLRLEVRNESNDTAQDLVFELAERIRNILRVRGLRATHMIGPSPCFFPRLQGRYRWHIVLRGADPVKAIDGLDLRGVRVEVDPPSLL